MKKQMKYTNEPLGRLAVAEDFLPPPEDLAFRDEVEKVTIVLSRRSLDFFRTEAAPHGTQYQPTIRKLLDAYASAFTAPATKRSGGPRKPRLRGTRARQRAAQRSTST